ncbi:AEC family transporter [aff. Roholtiella sp. LEGE 12411]|uniref:AEC family transporter n=1 Tax=aff. Roholtiella sp. LEGE 12411 TaxID=1828822 RepID=UPI00187F2538|nr:AEC family transporter [aff. Roholtiella sp. LEGE 12411]MBE9036113.1 AEC family transporter [aff. Roholtiella sp. LEGE 12411]
MMETLFHAYTPLLTWIGLGFLISRFIPDSFLKLLGYALYWVGIPLQLLVLARHTNLSTGGLIPGIAVGILVLSLILALLIWWGRQWLMSRKEQPKQESLDLSLNTSSSINSLMRASLGSFLLATILGNTGFVGLTLTQVLTSPENTDWAVLFSVTNNVVGTYGIAVLIASYFGKSQTQNRWWIQLRDLATVPSLWTFFIGLNTQFVELPAVVESGLNQAVWVVIAFALLLVGLRLGTMRGWKNLEIASIASVLKVFIVPALVGLGATYLGVTGEQRLVLVLMSGTPTGLSVLILAEVYDLDRNLLASSIALTFVGLFFALPLWLAWFG